MWWSTPKPKRDPLPVYSSYTGAGCLFTDGIRVLAGFQPTKKHKGITGLGGWSNENEHWLQTAHREVIEELFSTAVVPQKLLDAMAELVPAQTFCESDYVTVVYTFKDLERILALAKWHGVGTYIYPSFPKTIGALLLQRQTSKVAEVQTLCLLPLAECSLAPEFMADIKTVSLNM
jgi:hypothetical protein